MRRKADLLCPGPIGKGAERAPLFLIHCTASSHEKWEYLVLGPLALPTGSGWGQRDPRAKGSPPGGGGAWHSQGPWPMVPWPMGPWDVPPGHPMGHGPPSHPGYCVKGMPSGIPRNLQAAQKQRVFTGRRGGKALPTWGHSFLCEAAVRRMARLQQRRQGS